MQVLFESRDPQGVQWREVAVHDTALSRSARTLVRGLRRTRLPQRPARAAFER